MKKVFFMMMLVSLLFLTGCGKNDEKELKNDFVKNTNNLKSYYMEGVMSLLNNDDTYNYDVEVSYLKDDYYKVSLINQSNNYEQIILKNNDGVYVITPSLNKSFKFQSDWPNNSSQAYLLSSIAKDLDNDSDYTFKLDGDNYIYNIDADYPNNSKIVSQNITLDKNGDLKQVDVLDKDGISYITFVVSTFDKNATFNDNYFDLDEVTKDFSNNKVNNNDSSNSSTDSNSSNRNSSTDSTMESSNTEETISIDDALYPLYIPENTSLSNREVIDIDGGERVIMTFSGDNPFMLVQETVSRDEELTIVPTYGEPYLLIDTVGSLTDMSYTWTSNGIEYYIVSDVLSQSELLEIAKSINVVATISEK